MTVHDDELEVLDEIICFEVVHPGCGERVFEPCYKRTPYGPDAQYWRVYCEGPGEWKHL